MATQLKLYRDKHKLTQDALANLVGMSERAYNVHEKGKGGACRFQTQVALAEVLAVPVSTLFTKNGKAK